MSTIKNVTVATTAGLVFLGTSAAHSESLEQIAQEVTAKQAIDIALAAVPGQVHEVELEREDDRLVWEVELVASQDNKEYEILISATSGEILEMDIDDEDHWNILSWIDHE